MTVNDLKVLFVSREDTYSLQLPNGVWAKQDMPITDEMLDKHLKGSATIGLYQILPPNTLKWGCIDIDLDSRVHKAENFNIEIWKDKLLEQANIFKEALKNIGITSYIEFSGFKGYHVWFFFKEQVNAKIVKDFTTLLGNENTPILPEIRWDIFPAQDSVDENAYGSLVKLPLAFHQKSGKYSRFIDAEPTIDTVIYTDIEQLRKYNEEYLFWRVVRKCRAINTMWENDLASKFSHNSHREILGYIYAKIPNSLEFLKKHFFSKLNDYNEDVTEKHFRLIEKKYKPIKCDTMQSAKYDHVCKEQCLEIKNHTSPIAFYTEERDRINPTMANSSILPTTMDAIKIVDGVFAMEVYNKKREKELKVLSNFVAKISETRTVEDDDTTYATSIFKIEVTPKTGQKVYVEITLKDYMDDKILSMKLMNKLGVRDFYCYPIQYVRWAIQKFSDPKNVVVIRHFGYNIPDAALNEIYPKIYYTPSILITAAGITVNDDIKMELPTLSTGGILDLKIINEEELEFVKEMILKHILILTDAPTSHFILANTFMPILHPFFNTDKTRYGFWLYGDSGVGKSYIMKIMQLFYGKFQSGVTWNSTGMSIQAAGYDFKDALYTLDDFKLNGMTEIQKKAIQNVIQNYADNTARMRLNSDSTTQNSKPIRGWLTSSGEEIPYESSNIARLVMIPIRPSTVDAHIRFASGNLIHEHSHLLPGFTAKYIQYILSCNPNDINKTYTNFRERYLKVVGKNPNYVRIAHNFAYLSTSYNYVMRFIQKDEDIDELMETFQKACEEAALHTCGISTDARSDNILLDILREGLASGRYYLQDEYQTNNRIGSKPIGYWAVSKNLNDNKPIVHLFFNICYTVVTEELKKIGKDLSHSKPVILGNFFTKELSYDKKEYVTTYNKQTVRVIRLKEGVLG